MSASAALSDSEANISRHPGATASITSAPDRWFTKASEGNDFGVPDLMMPTTCFDSTGAALEALGTDIPIIRHLETVAKVTGESLVTCARELGAPPDERVSRAISLTLNLPYLGRGQVERIDTGPLVETLPDGVEPGQLPGLPCGRIGRRILVMVPDQDAMRAMRRRYYDTEFALEYCIASPASIDALYRRKYADTEKPFDDAVAQERPPGDLIAALLIHAAAAGASDIHLEPRRNHGAIYLRVDGVRETFRILDLTRSDEDYQSGPVGGTFGRIMNLLLSQSGGSSDIDMTDEGTLESLIPPELRGRFDFRLHFTRPIWGVRAVIRLLDQSGQASDIADLGLDQETRAALHRITHSDSGMLLFSGPTGSGKSTTMAALLKTINPIHNSIQTIENPVEARAGLWVQHPISRRDSNQTEATKQFTIARGLLRSDPEVIQIQELRDAKGAMGAARMANTGHRVLATVHANSAPLAILALRDMQATAPSRSDGGGNDDQMALSAIVAALKGIVGQRLLRRLCPHCCRPDERPETAEALAEEAGYVGSPFYASEQGCDACRHTGYAGRQLVYELLVVDSQIADMVLQNISLTMLTALIPKEKRMQARAMHLVAKGVTSIDEVRRVISA